MKYSNYKELPCFLKTEEDENIAIHGYLQQATVEGGDEARQQAAIDLLEYATNYSLKTVGKTKTLDWLRELIINLELKNV